MNLRAFTLNASTYLYMYIYIYIHIYICDCGWLCCTNSTPECIHGMQPLHQKIETWNRTVFTSQTKERRNANKCRNLWDPTAHICLSVCPSICLSTNLSVCLYICICKNMNSQIFAHRYIHMINYKLLGHGASTPVSSLAARRRQATSLRGDDWLRGDPARQS